MKKRMKNTFILLLLGFFILQTHKSYSMISVSKESSFNNTLELYVAGDNEVSYSDY